MDLFLFFFPSPLFSQAHSKLATCQTCKTLIKTGEVLHGLGVGGVMGSFCSVNCLNKGKLTTASFVGKEPDDTTFPAMLCCFHFFALLICHWLTWLYMCPDSEISFKFHSLWSVLSLSRSNRQCETSNMIFSQIEMNSLHGCVLFWGVFPVFPVYC